MTEAVRLGVVGAGVIAQRGIIPNLIEPDVRDSVCLEAVCDPAPGRAKSVAERFGIPQWYESLDAMLERAPLDAVTIASPIGLHYDQGVAALRAGKHVHFNKTMCTTVAEASSLIQLAAASDLKIVASPGEVLRPSNRAIRRLIQSGGLGTLTWAVCGSSPGDYHAQESERDEASGEAPIRPDWYFERPGGGPLYDTTVYPLHNLTSVLGAARRVTAMSGIRIPVRSVYGKEIRSTADDTTLITLDYGDGLFALVYGVTYGEVNSGNTCYFGSRGAVDGYDFNGKPLPYPERLDLTGIPDPGWHQAELPHVAIGRHRELPESHVFEDIMQLVDSIRTGVPSAVSAEHARHVIDIFESAYRSAETGRAEELTTTFSLDPLGDA